MVSTGCKKAILTSAHDYSYEPLRDVCEARGTVNDSLIVNVGGNFAFELLAESRDLVVARSKENKLVVILQLTKFALRNQNALGATARALSSPIRRVGFLNVEVIDTFNTLVVRSAVNILNKTIDELSGEAGTSEEDIELSLDGVTDTLNGDGVVGHY